MLVASCVSVYVRVRAFIPPRLRVRFYTVVKYRTRYVTLRKWNSLWSLRGPLSRVVRAWQRIMQRLVISLSASRSLPVCCCFFAEQVFAPRADRTAEGRGPSGHCYTVNHKNVTFYFSTITLANLSRFLQFLYHFNREEILHATIIKFITSPDLCAHRVVQTEPVCCEPRQPRVEASSVSLCRRWRRTFWTLLMIATLKITMSKWQHCKFDKLTFCSLLLWT